MWASVTGVGWVGMGWGCGSYRAMKMIAKSFKKILGLERGPEAKAVPAVGAKAIRLA